MPVSLSIKNVPDELAEALRERAKRSHRSVQGELMAIVEEALRRPPFAAQVRETAPAWRQADAPPSEGEIRARLKREGRTFTVTDLYDYVQSLGIQTPDEATAMIRQMRDERHGLETPEPARGLATAPAERPPRVEIPRAKIAEFCRKWKITEFSLFGSVLRDDFRPDSDVDVLVRFEAGAPWSLLDLAAMQNELEAVFGRRVELVEADALRNPFRRHAILSTRRVVYAA
jgi:hypothetical protein